MSFEEPLYISSYPNYDRAGLALNESVSNLRCYCGRTWQNLSKVKETALLIVPPVIMLSGLVVSLICQENCHTTEGDTQCTSLCSDGLKITAAIFGFFGGVGTLGTMVAMNCTRREEALEP